MAYTEGFQKVTFNTDMGARAKAPRGLFSKMIAFFEKAGHIRAEKALYHEFAFMSDAELAAMNMKRDHANRIVRIEGTHEG